MTQISEVSSRTDEGDLAEGEVPPLVCRGALAILMCFGFMIDAAPEMGLERARGTAGAGAWVEYIQLI